MNRLLGHAWEHNPFYRRKWTAAGVRQRRLSRLEDLADFPLTMRVELVADQTASPPLGSNRARPLAEFRRIHRSSGTTRTPVFWGDTARTWRWILEGSERLFQLAGVQPADRLLFAMGFGPSSGPWIIYEGAHRLGCLCFTSAAVEVGEQRRWLEQFRPSILVGKPSALLALAAAGPGAGRRPASPGVRMLILTGEPNFESLRGRLERAWGAECFDRYGLTEAGSVAGECPAHPGGMHLLDEAFIAESIDPLTGRPVANGAPGELVLTTLGRVDRPIIRYRTGDRVRLVRDYACACGRSGTLLLGGVRRLGADETPKARRKP
ncbi:MAG: AMP-binding protein [Verrucomicrobia bacterium]|nr:AMP-binding protein [Verrucomicrobiota bacterium]